VSVDIGFRRRWTFNAAALTRWGLFQPLIVAGVVLVGGWIFVAVLAPWIAPYDPLSLTNQLLAPPSARHLFGTDVIGRDILSRVLWGARVSLPLAMLLVVGIVLIGSTLGAVAGYFGGLVDTVIMRLADLVFAFPVILLAMTVTASIGPGLRNAVIAVMLIAWPSYARVVRGLVTSLGRADYVSATRLLGASTRRALMTDVLPNIAGPIIVLATIDIGRGVLLLSALSFLGLGAQPPQAEWGSMVAAGTQYFDRWWLGLFPGLAIFTTVLGFTFLGDSLRDALDPKSSWSRGGRED
jgi:ABC-type dipeptide/oligopeptide/nickel transport system permease subunit